jgi:hypothetical protein
LNGIATHLNEDSHNAQHNIAVSTYGTLIYAVDLVKQPTKGAASKWVDINKYQKPVGYDGITMVLTDAWLIFKANRVQPPMDSGVFAYKYGKNEDPYVFTSLDLSGNTGGSIPPPPGDDEPVPPGSLANLPVTLFKHEGTSKQGNTVTKTVIAVGTNNPNSPIRYYALDNM